MIRWMEEFELKHVDFMRCIKSFDTMRTVWSTMASKSSSLAAIAIARKESAKYSTLHEDASSLHAKTAEPRFRVMTEGTLVKIIQDFRDRELSWFRSYIGDD